MSAHINIFVRFSPKILCGSYPDSTGRNFKKFHCLRLSNLYSHRQAVHFGYSSKYSLYQNSQCGEREIRTPGALADTPVFKTGAINRSAISPKMGLHPFIIYILFSLSLLYSVGLFVGTLFTEVVEFISLETISGDL